MPPPLCSGDFGIQATLPDEEAPEWAFSSSISSGITERTNNRDWDSPDFSKLKGIYLRKQESHKDDA
jgi:hypothetical protein